MLGRETFYTCTWVPRYRREAIDRQVYTTALGTATAVRGDSVGLVAAAGKATSFHNG
jgi:hypothetical protein